LGNYRPDNYDILSVRNSSAQASLKSRNGSNMWLFIICRNSGKIRGSIPYQETKDGDNRMRFSIADCLMHLVAAEILQRLVSGILRYRFSCLTSDRRSGFLRLESRKIMGHLLEHESEIVEHLSFPEIIAHDGRIPIMLCAASEAH
jgi:hypothetical protein